VLLIKKISLIKLNFIAAAFLQPLSIIKHSLVLSLLCFNLTIAEPGKDPVPKADFSAPGIWLYGSLVQGGLVRGLSPESEKITIFNQEVYLAADGSFVFGIGRDAPAKIAISRLNKTGETSTFAVPVRQRDYKLQRIDGVDDKFVRELSPELKKRTRHEAGLVWKARQTIRPVTEYLLGFTWPAEGPVTGVYGSQRIFNGVPKRPHYGLDIAGPVGTPVLAPAAGEVTLVHPDMYYSGGTLIIDHGHGVSSTFIHLSKIHTKEGQIVRAGQLIADMGETGRVTGPHLDWRVNWFNQRLDPQLLLPPRTEP